MIGANPVYSLGMGSPGNMKSPNNDIEEFNKTLQNSPAVMSSQSAKVEPIEIDSTELLRAKEDHQISVN
jgi:hypothetical protein